MGSRLCGARGSRAPPGPAPSARRARDPSPKTPIFGRFFSLAFLFFPGIAASPRLLGVPRSHPPRCCFIAGQPVPELFAFPVKVAMWPLQQGTLD